MRPKLSKVALAVRLFICSLLLLSTSLHAEQSALEQAWSLAAKGDRNGAIDLLRTMIREKPSDSDARLLLGSLQSEAGQREESINQLTEAVRLRPNSWEACNALGEAYSHFGDSKEARVAFEKSVHLNPHSGVAQENLAAVLLLLGDASAAAPHLDRAITLLKQTPEAGDAHYLRAKIYAAENNIAASLRQLQTAVSIRPNFAEAWSDLGAARSANGDSEGAILAFRKAIELNAHEAIAQYRLGAEYLRRAEPQLAIEPLQAAFRLNPDDQSTLNTLQSALRQAGRQEEAAAIRRKLAEVLRARDLKSQNALKALQINNEGSALEKAGDMPAALVRYREAVALNPDHAGIRTNYAIALLRLAQWTEGLTELHRAVELDPNNTNLTVVLQDAISKAPPNLVPEWARSNVKH